MVDFLSIKKTNICAEAFQKKQEFYGAKLKVNNLLCNAEALNKDKNSKTEKDFKSVYKKIKRNKKYFISIKDVVVFESLAADGVNLPNDLN